MNRVLPASSSAHFLWRYVMLAPVMCLDRTSFRAVRCFEKEAALPGRPI